MNRLLYLHCVVFPHIQGKSSIEEFAIIPFLRFVVRKYIFVYDKVFITGLRIDQLLGLMSV